MTVAFIGFIGTSFTGGVPTGGQEADAQDSPKPAAEKKTDQFVQVAQQENKPTIDSASQVKIKLTKTQIDSMLKALDGETVTAENSRSIAKKLYDSHTNFFMTNGIKEQVYKVAKILTEAKLQKLPQIDLDELTKRLAHLSGGFDIKTDADGKEIIEDLKKTHPDAVAYEASTRFLQALEKASQALPKEADKAALFQAGLENGIAYEMYVPAEDRLAGKISPEAQELSENIAEIISSLDPKTKQAAFKAAGYLMNWAEPIKLLEKNLRKDTAAENETFKTFIGSLNGSIDTEAQQKITMTFLNHANKKYFGGKLDATTLEQVSRVEDPLKLIDSDTKVEEFGKVLEKLLAAKPDKQKTTAIINTLLNIASRINDPKFYTSSDPVKYQEYIGEAFDFDQAIPAFKSELEKLKPKPAK